MCPLGPENQPTRIFPALSYVSDDLYEWAALDENKFVTLAKDIVKKEHDRALDDKTITPGIIRNIKSLQEAGLSEDEIIDVSTRRYHGIMKALEEFSQA